MTKPRGTCPGASHQVVYQRAGTLSNVVIMAARFMPVTVARAPGNPPLIYGARAGCRRHTANPRENHVPRSGAPPYAAPHGQRLDREEGAHPLDEAGGSARRARRRCGTSSPAAILLTPATRCDVGSVFATGESYTRPAHHKMGLKHRGTTDDGRDHRHGISCCQPMSQDARIVLQCKQRNR